MSLRHQLAPQRNDKDSLFLKKVVKDYDVSYDPKYTLVENQKNNGVSFGTIETIKSRHEIIKETKPIKSIKTEIPKKQKKQKIKAPVEEPDEIDLYFAKMKRSQLVVQKDENVDNKDET